LDGLEILKEVLMVIQIVTMLLILVLTLTKNSSHGGKLSYHNQEILISLELLTEKIAALKDLLTTESMLGIINTTLKTLFAILNHILGDKRLFAILEANILLFNYLTEQTI
jgi:hypothetical protein